MKASGYEFRLFKWWLCSLPPLKMWVCYAAFLLFGEWKDIPVIWATFCCAQKWAQVLCSGKHIVATAIKLGLIICTRWSSLTSILSLGHCSSFLRRYFGVTPWCLVANSGVVLLLPSIAWGLCDAGVWIWASSTESLCSVLRSVSPSFKFIWPQFPDLLICSKNCNRLLWVQDIHIEANPPISYNWF